MSFPVFEETRTYRKELSYVSAKAHKTVEETVDLHLWMPIGRRVHLWFGVDGETGQDALRLVVLGRDRTPVETKVLPLPPGLPLHLFFGTVLSAVQLHNKGQTRYILTDLHWFRGIDISTTVEQCYKWSVVVRDILPWFPGTLFLPALTLGPGPLPGYPLHHHEVRGWNRLGPHVMYAVPKGNEAYAKSSDAVPKGSDAYAKGNEAYAKSNEAYAKSSDAYAKGSDAYAKGSDAYAKGSESSQPPVGNKETVSPHVSPAVSEIPTGGLLPAVKSEAGLRHGEVSLRQSEASLRQSEAGLRHGEAGLRHGEAGLRHGEAMFVPNWRKPQYHQETRFWIMADPAYDLYKLYARGVDGSPVFVDYACVIDRATSHWLNGLFRNMIENRRIDAIEESDDEEDFQIVRENKYTDLEKKFVVRCRFQNRLKKWLPVVGSERKQLEYTGRKQLETAKPTGEVRKQLETISIQML